VAAETLSMNTLSAAVTSAEGSVTGAATPAGSVPPAAADSRFAGVLDDMRVSASGNRATPAGKILPLADLTKLDRTTLGPTVQVLTSGQRAPDEQSLIAFARAQGIDESIVGELMRQTSGDSQSGGPGAAMPSIGMLLIDPARVDSVRMESALSAPPLDEFVPAPLSPDSAGAGPSPIESDLTTRSPADPEVSLVVSLDVGAGTSLDDLQSISAPAEPRPGVDPAVHRPASAPIESGITVKARKPASGARPGNDPEASARALPGLPPEAMVLPALVLDAPATALLPERGSPAGAHPLPETAPASRLPGRSPAAPAFSSDIFPAARVYASQADAALTANALTDGQTRFETDDTPGTPVPRMPAGLTSPGTAPAEFGRSVSAAPGTTASPGASPPQQSMVPPPGSAAGDRINDAGPLTPVDAGISAATTSGIQVTPVVTGAELALTPRSLDEQAAPDWRQQLVGLSSSQSRAASLRAGAATRPAMLPAAQALPAQVAGTGQGFPTGTAAHQTAQSDGLPGPAWATGLNSPGGRFSTPAPVQTGSLPPVRDEPILRPAWARQDSGAGSSPAAPVAAASAPSMPTPTEGGQVPAPAFTLNEAAPMVEPLAVLPERGQPDLSVTGPVAAATASPTSLPIDTDAPAVDATDAPVLAMDTRREHHHEQAERLADALGGQISAAIRRGDWRVELRLNPGHLGRVDITMQASSDGRVDAQIMTSSSHARELVSAGLTHLRDTLGAAGISTGQLEVQQSAASSDADQRPSDNAGGGALAQFSQQGFGQNARDDLPRDTVTGAASSDASLFEPPRSLPDEPVPAGRLDVRV
jgi:flagellar hook-length control protein FliK